MINTTHPTPATHNSRVRHTHANTHTHTHTRTHIYTYTHIYAYTTPQRMRGVLLVSHIPSCHPSTSHPITYHPYNPSPLHPITRHPPLSTLWAPSGNLHSHSIIYRLSQGTAWHLELSADQLCLALCTSHGVFMYDVAALAQKVLLDLNSGLLLSPLSLTPS